MRSRSCALFMTLCAWAPASAFAQADRARADLSAGEVATPAEIVAGGALRVRARLNNAGSASARFSWTVYLTVGGVLGDAIELGSFPLELAAGASAQVDRVVSVPSSASGRHVVAVVADARGEVEESNEYDNVALSTGSVLVRAPLAELRVSGVRLGATSLRAAAPLAIDAVVGNAGELAASFEVAAYLTKDAAPSPNDPELGRTRVSLAAGAGATVRIDATLPARIDAGSYRVAVIVDPEQRVAERIDFDNIRLATQSLTILADAIEWRTDSLPGGTVFIPYLARLAANGGNGSIRYALVGGALPAGLQLDPGTGLISGRPQASGEFRVNLAALSNGVRAERTFDFSIARSGVDLTITTPTLERGTIGLPYSAAVIAAGGEPPYRFDVVDGALPPGVDLNRAGGLSGIPRTEGRFTVSIQVTDGRNARDEAEYEILIGAANVVLLTQGFDAVPLGQPINKQLAATGGREPYRWQAKSATPPGTSLTEDGRLVGTPSEVGEFRFLVRVLDASRAGADDTALVHLTVFDAGPFEIATQDGATAVIREKIALRLSAFGGVPPLSWSIAPGESLPQGFKLVPSETKPTTEAYIEGTSIRAMHHGVTVLVEDAAGRTREATLAIRVIFPNNANDSGCACARPTTGGTWALGLLGLALLFRRRAR